MLQVPQEVQFKKIKLACLKKFASRLRRDFIGSECSLPIFNSLYLNISGLDKTGRKACQRQTRGMEEMVSRSTEGCVNQQFSKNTGWLSVLWNRVRTIQLLVDCNISTVLVPGLKTGTVV
ncbi:hypothetical protein Y032_0190g1272 [Ancylostoma ceylanicum]|uniref:Uncharacterized protein n=1 Tax=Ancylostoma ceylanicum TaxID=53326 RepID=A0A016SQZ5_9BILA|nr:hypothetical protein Y032_0190g1272 [Ancylostoma ceylanicum]